MPSNNIKIEIEGENLSEFLNGSVSLQLDQFCNTFSFSTTKTLVGEYNIYPQDSCNIYINGKKAITGVIDTVNPSEDASSSTVDISGRDITCDVVDSDLPENINLSGNFTLKTVIEKVVKSLGLSVKVINQVKDLRGFTSKDIVAAEVDKNCFEFINEYAQKVSALLITDSDGNIVITRAGNEKYQEKLLNDVGNEDNNILSSNAGYDYSQRYYKYIVYSQDNANTQKGNVSLSNVSQKGIAIDDEIRRSRVMVKKADNSCGSSNCQDIATLEANIRRANSLKYSCVTYGYETNDGNLWKINKLIQVYDVDCDIDSELLIKGITFNLGDGATTDMEFALADAYKLQASLDEVEGRTNKTKKTKKKGKKGKKKKSKGLSEADNAKLNSLLGI